MKNLLIGILALGSVSLFAKEFEVKLVNELIIKYSEQEQDYPSNSDRDSLRDLQLSKNDIIMKNGNHYTAYQVLQMHNDEKESLFNSDYCIVQVKYSIERLEDITIRNFKLYTNEGPMSTNMRINNSLMKISQHNRYYAQDQEGFYSTIRCKVSYKGSTKSFDASKFERGVDLETSFNGRR